MSSIQLAADALAGTPAAGQKEFNGTIFTAAPTATTRGIIPAEQFYALNAGLAGANATGAQNILGVGVTLAASTIYEFELMFGLSKAAGATSHTVSTGFGGTATLNNIIYTTVTGFSATAFSGNSSANATENIVQVATATSLGGSVTSASVFWMIVIKGTVSINAGGTFIPQYTLSAAPGGAYTTAAGSYMKIKPIGAAGSNVSVGTWA